jgi:hypothetical protein
MIDFWRTFFGQPFDSGYAPRGGSVPIPTPPAGGSWGGETPPWFEDRSPSGWFPDLAPPDTQEQPVFNDAMVRNETTTTDLPEYLMRPDYNAPIEPPDYGAPPFEPGQSSQMSMQGTGYDPNGTTGISVEPDAIPSPTPPLFAPGMPPGQQLNYPNAPTTPGSSAVVNNLSWDANTNQGVGGDFTTPNQGFTGGDYGHGFAVNSVPNPDGGVWWYDQNWQYVGASGGMDEPPSTVAYAGDPGASAPGTAAPGMPNVPLTSPYTQNTGANGVFGTNPDIYGTPPSTRQPVIYPNQGATNPNGTPIIDPRTGQPVAGTILSDADQAKRFAMTQFPGDPRYSPSSVLHPGQTAVKLLSDGTRVLVDATGKIISGGIQAGEDLFHNIMNDPRNTDPAYLESIGYRPGQGTDSFYPGTVTGPTAGPFDVGAYGVGHEGGSFFHDTTLTNNGIIDPATNQPIFDRGASTMNPGGYNFPVHGPTSVAGASAGGMGPITNANALGSRSGALSILDRQYLMRMKKGLYTSAAGFGALKQGMPDPFGGPPGPAGGNWNAFHAGQVQLGDILRANPAYYQSLTNPMPKTGLGPSTPGERIGRGTPPTLPT